MALPNNSNVVTYTFGEDEHKGSILLQASFRRLKALSEAVGQDAILYISDAISFGAGEEAGNQNPYEMTAAIVNVLFHLQAGTETYTQDEIYDWLFGNLLGFFTSENTLELVRELLLAKGTDI